LIYALFLLLFLKQKKRMEPCARDALIEFVAGSHKYTCAGEGNYISVTTWNHTHFPAFDADAIIKKMRLDQPTCKYYGETPEQIKAGWDKNRDEAAQLGTEMHAAIERYWLGVATPTPPIGSEVEGGVDTAISPTSGGVEGGVETALSPASGGCRGAPPIPMFEAFVAAHPHIKPYRAEWMIFDEDVRLAGSIDFVAKNADGTLTIYDWKRCKEIKKTNSFGTFALTECISHLPDTNYWHYALQLNTYKTILERKYEKKVKEMFLVCLHPAQTKYQVLKVPALEKEMADLFALRRTQL